MKYRLLLILVTIAILSTGLLWWGHNHPRHQAQPQPRLKTSQPSKQTLPKKPTFVFNKGQYSLDNPTSPWVVVNKKRPLDPLQYTPTDLSLVGNGQYLRIEAAKALTKMLADAKLSGYLVTAGSGYRSYTTQVSVYNNEVKTYGQSVADSESARPGHSEHQTGWAVDLNSGGCNITDCFGNTPGGRWVTSNSFKYGFLLRYPADKVNITGYRHESWHFRYVGAALSQQMHNNQVETLEEFFGLAAAGTP